MNENKKLASFLKCDFVICDQHFKACMYLNNYTPIVMGKYKKDTEIKSDRWK